MDARSLWLILTILAACQSSGVAPRLKLNDGKEVPALGLGTWLGFTKDGGRVQLKGNEIEKAVEWAIDAGYRHIDTAAIYNTESQVGIAVNQKIAEGVVKREDLFITTKLWNTHHAKDAVVPALQESLQKLNLTYVDLYLIHWPIAESEDHKLESTDYLETWKGMIEARDRGLTRSIGVSNFNQAQLDRLLANTDVKPVALQVEINLNLQQPELLAYCKRQGITVTGYTPFGSLFPSRAADDAPLPRVDDPALVAIAQKYNKTVPQIVLRYEVELGVIPIPKSTTKERVEQNIDVFDFKLSQEDRDVLKAFDKNYRVIPVKHWKDSIYYPFEKN
ncbi:unnamed protein product [Chilo suppressalis]|uniref:NADP-dependent oxidoreductase domain-containing protein n=1 Tax=Chilo suppressalis TaxID=168631 RepID=A0ABN8BAD4_CHISP|nr:hypothetical protein evm_005605 [Chilo suppressalis]CAH0404282.1 unnamed protein product [Chilo suppressalis]